MLKLHCWKLVRGVSIGGFDVVCNVSDSVERFKMVVIALTTLYPQIGWLP